jgi:Hypothetical protein (DUF2513)
MMMARVSMSTTSTRRINALSMPVLVLSKSYPTCRTGTVVVWSKTYEAGFIEVRDLSNLSGKNAKPTRLTWQAHESLDAARNDTIWSRAKDIALEKTGALSLEALKISLAIAIKAELCAA